MQRVTLTIPEAAKAMGISKSWLWMLIWRGEIPVVKIGRRRLIRRETLEDWLKKCES